MPTIIADSREHNSGIIKLLKATPNLNVTIEQLECGDYMIHNDFVVERKAASDFIASIRDGRMFSQVKLMKANFEKVALILEGDLYSFPHGFTPESLQGALSALAVLEGVSVIPTRNAADTAGLLATMARHSQDGLGYEINLRVGKPKDTKVLQQFIIESLPGCGAKRAQDILKHFNSVYAAINATQEDWAAVPGLGKATAAKVYEIIHGKYQF